MDVYMYGLPVAAVGLPQLKGLTEAWAFLNLLPS